MRVIGIQMDIVWESKEKNFAMARKLLEHAQPSPNDLVLLPEMFATGFTMNASAMAEAYGGPTEEFLGRVAAEFRIYLMAGAAMRARNGRARNKALVFSPEGRLVGWYSKMRLFTPGGEHTHYEAGSRISLFDWRGHRVAPFICYDLRFPELFREAASTHRPELFCVIANFPQKRIGHWTRLLQARAIENQAYVAAVNRVGRDPYYEYNGRSMLIDPHGEVVADAGAGAGFFKGVPDFETLTKYRAGLPFLNDLMPARAKSPDPGA